MFIQYIDSPLGPIEICASTVGISAISFVSSCTFTANPSALTKQAQQQLLSYFAGGLSQFQLPLDTTGTLFQQQVWQSLCTIPFGHTCSYADIASRINKPTAMRAVGAANGRNPVAIVVPCHRVIGANGTLTGYAGGLDKKAWLLQHERRQ